MTPEQPAKPTPIRHLGTMNNWKDGAYPEAYTRCKELKHERREQNNGRCLNTYTCDTCRISYTIDSSD